MFGTYFSAQTCLYIYIYISIWAIILYMGQEYIWNRVNTYKLNTCHFDRDCIFGGGYYEISFKDI